jgi:hypothetical protein
MQITAEQIIREAMERVQAEPRKVKTRINSEEEFDDYKCVRAPLSPAGGPRGGRHCLALWWRSVAAADATGRRLRKRREFEDTVRRVRGNMGTWIKYAMWEAAQQEFDRSGRRSRTQQQQRSRTRSCAARDPCSNARWRWTTATRRCGSSTPRWR